MFNYNDPSKNLEGKIDFCALLSVNWIHNAALKFYEIKIPLSIKISLGH